MSKKVLSKALIITLAMSSASVFAAPNYSVQTQNPYVMPQNPYTYNQPQMYSSQSSSLQPLQGSLIMIPAGACIPAMTNMPLSSETMMLGQNVSIPVSNNYYYNNTLVAPAGSSLNGTVIDVKKAGHAGVNGQLMVKFTNITTPYGQMIPISGVIKTDDGTGLLKGGTKMDTTKDYAKDIAVGSALGAIGGTIMGPLSGGKVGKGAALGTAVGATGGLAKSLWDRGAAVEIPAGSQLDVVVDQPITFQPQQGYQY